VLALARKGGVLAAGVDRRNAGLMGQIDEFAHGKKAPADTRALCLESVGLVPVFDMPGARVADEDHAGDERHQCEHDRIGRKYSG